MSNNARRNGKKAPVARSKHLYQVIDNEGVIWGRGETVDDAYQAAIENITGTFTDAGEELPEWLLTEDLERAGFKIR